MKLVKSIVKLTVDLKFLQFYQLLPKFTNFYLFDVSANGEDATVQFRNQLLEQ